MNSKEFIRKLAFYKPFQDAARKFSSSKTDTLFMCRSQFHNCFGSYFKTVLFSFYPDVNTYDCSDEELDYIIIDRYSRFDFKRDLQFFHGFFVKCSKFQQFKVRSELSDLCSIMDIFFTNSLNK